MNKKMESTTCNCSPTWAQRHMHRLVIASLVVILAFWVGMKLGEIKGFIMADAMNSESRHGGMMLYRMDSRDMGMMKKEAPAPAAPQAPTVQE